jgi:hypothetical protein
LSKANSFDLETEGVWFAVLKNGKVSIQFRNDEDGLNSMNGTTFLLTDFKDLPREKQGTFSLMREAGTMEFNGKFEGDQGMGRYRFASNKRLADYIKSEGVNETTDKDLMTFFMVDVNRPYIQMLKSEGYSNLGKNDLVPLAALRVDAAFIRSNETSRF